MVFPETKFSRRKTSFHLKYHMLYRIPKFCVKYQCGFLKYTLIFQNTSKIQNFLECTFIFICNTSTNRLQTTQLWCEWYLKIKKNPLTDNLAKTAYYLAFFSLLSGKKSANETPNWEQQTDTLSHTKLLWHNNTNKQKKCDID